MRFWLLSIPLILLVGCGDDDPKLVGTWDSHQPGNVSTYHFRPDNTYQLEIRIDTVDATVNGEYRTESGKLVLIPKEVTSKGPEARKAFLEERMRIATRVPMTWHSADSFTLNNPGYAPLEMNRTSTTP